MAYSRKLGPPIVSAAIATIVLTNFAMATIVRSTPGPDHTLFKIIWPIAVASAVAVILVMSLLYRSLADLVLELESREKAAKHQAVHDQLTGLPNRALLEDRISQALTRVRRDGVGTALLVLDLDRFKQVNDTLGHAAGDLLVQQVGERLQLLLRETDTVARIGGDEFAIIQSAPKNEGDVRRLCERIIEAVGEPFDLSGREARVGVSVGAVLATSDATDAAELVRKADITMYRAKASGRNCFRLFSDEMDAAVQRRDHVESALREALDSGKGVQLNYQPQLDSHGRVTGAEGMLHWHHPTLGEIAPSEIIAVAGECGLIDSLGEFAFLSACRAARRWPDLSLSLNLFPLQFRRDDLPSRLWRLAAAEGVRPEQMELEITESVFVEHGECCEQSIKQFRASGFRIALDDFGTGYSSLSCLRRFPVDTIKLHRSFLDFAAPGENMPIISAAVSLGHAIGVHVVAEGISTSKQEQVALEAGCDGLQGDLYAAPMSADALDAFVKRGGSKGLAIVA